MRIEIPVHYDLWMQGAQYGRVERTDKNGAWIVRLDHPQVKKLLKIPQKDQEFCRIL